MNRDLEDKPKFPPLEISSPIEWDEGLCLIYHPGSGVQVDDVDMVFSNEYHDVTRAFRHLRFMWFFAGLLEQAPSEPCILNAPDSVGCQSYTLSSVFYDAGLYGAKHPRIFSTDISSRKMEAGETGVFPDEFFILAPPDYERFFTYNRDREVVIVKPDIKEKVTFLPATNLVKEQPADFPFYATLCFNLMIYLSAEDQTAMLKNLSAMTSDIIALSYGSSDNRQRAYSTLTREGFDHLTEGSEIGIGHIDLYSREPLSL